jgi:hypothetical protein
MKHLLVVVPLLTGALTGAPLLLGSPPPQPGVFFVTGYGASGTHTDYDMARQAADAYAAANLWTGSVLILKPSVNVTCDAVPLPSLGVSSTTSIIGAGSGVSSIVKNPECPTSAATLRHNDSPNGALSRGWYQGFTVDANHVDLAGCEIYGMSLTTFVDVSCGNAVANGDHELEFGNRDANSVGWMDNIYLYDLKTFDSVIAGRGAVLTPVWASGVLKAVTVSNGGTSPYTTQYTRAQLTGADLSTCSSVPALRLTLNSRSYIEGATITNAGACQSTAHLYILVQDGTPVTYGMKFSNIADSHIWGLSATNSSTYGEGWLDGSANNSIYNEQPDANQLIQITDNANGNRHINPLLINSGGYAVAIYSQNGTFQNALLAWDSSSYIAASGYFIGNDPRVFQDWMIQKSSCGTVSSNDFIPITTRDGTLSANNPLPPGVKPQNIQVCDGTNTVDWAVTGP